MDDLIITPRHARRSPSETPGILASHPFVAIDLETTGFSDAHRIVEIGAIKMRPNGEVIDRFDRIVNPGNDVPLPSSAERIHGIRPHQIRSAQPIDEALNELTAFIGSSGLVAHQLSFENRFLTAAYRRSELPVPAWQGLCSLATARQHCRNAANHKLGYLLDLFDLPAVNSHRAADDAFGCGSLMAYLISRLGVDDLEPLPQPSAIAHRNSPAADDRAFERAVDVLAGTLGATELPPHSAARQVNETESGTEPFTPAAHDQTAGQPQSMAATLLRSPRMLHDAFGGHAPTDEQLAAVDAFTSGGNTKLEAVAGSGKTSTLLGIARLELQRNPHRKGLNLAFNRSVADEAERRFPSNVASMTAHSLAKRQIKNSKYGPLLGKMGERIPWRDTAAAIYPARTIVDMPDGPKLFSSYVIGRYALRAVEEFCRTVATSISIEHMPAIAGVIPGSPQEAQLAEAVIPCAQRAWRNLLDPNSFAVQFNHSHYLKLFVDSEPRLGRPGDFLLFDEAQDTNPILAKLVAMQDHLQVVLVGDTNQSIYRFNGAINSMARFHAEHSVTLSQSFRFGDAIAEAANVVLERLNSRVLVRGNQNIDDRIDFRLANADAVLSRTNGGAIAEVMQVQKGGKSAALIGDTKAARRFCESARSLKEGVSPDDPQFAAFSTWGDLQEYVENQPGMSDIATQAKLIDSHGVDALEDALGNLVSPQRADVVCSTAHKSKGAEFPRVRIADDFEDPEANNDQPFPLSPEEVTDERRLAYVTLTRAQNALNPGRLLQSKHLTVRRDAPAGALFSV